MLRRLLAEKSIFADVKESNYKDLLSSLFHKFHIAPAGIHMDELMGVNVRCGVSLSWGFSKDLIAPQMALCVSRWGLEMPDGGHAFLLFFLFLPEIYQATAIKAGIKSEIEKVVCDRFILERVKIAETSEEVLEVLLREHGMARAAVPVL